MSGGIKPFATLLEQIACGTCSISTASIRISRLAALIAVCIINYRSAYAQFDQSNRFEMPIEASDGNFDVIPAQHDGLYLLRRLSSANADHLQIIKLDTSFTMNWQGFLDVDKKFELMGKITQRSQLFLLFRHRELVKKDLQLVVVNNDAGTYVRHTVRNYVAFVPTDFQVTKFAAIIGGYFNSVPVVIHYSFKTGNSKVLPGLLNEAGELTQIKADSTGAFAVLISAKNLENQKTIWIRSYDPEGSLLSQYPLQPEHNKHLIFARSVSTNQSLELMAGTYGNRNSEYSKGIFIASVDENGFQQLKYYNYGDLGNFFNYMRAKREQRVKERIERRKVRGKKIRFNYRFIVHEIVPYKNQFVLLGEAFYPKYVSVERSYYGGSFFSPYVFNSGSLIRNGRIFDGYRYTHAVVMGFDKEGKLLWDNSFEINDVKTYSLDQFVKLEMKSDHIALFYLYENQIRSKIIRANEVLEGKSYLPLRTKFNTDVPAKGKTATSKLEYWYDGYFYAFGTQTIDNSMTGSRRVFFLNKIRYDGTQ